MRSFVKILSTIVAIGSLVAVSTSRLSALDEEGTCSPSQGWTCVTATSAYEGKQCNGGGNCHSCCARENYICATEWRDVDNHRDVGCGIN